MSKPLFWIAFNNSILSFMLPIATSSYAFTCEFLLSCIHRLTALQYTELKRRGMAKDAHHTRIKWDLYSFFWLFFLTLLGYSVIPLVSLVLAQVLFDKLNHFNAKYEETGLNQKFSFLIYCHLMVKAIKRLGFWRAFAFYFFLLFSHLHYKQIIKDKIQWQVNIQEEGIQTHHDHITDCCIFRLFWPFSSQ